MARKRDTGGYVVIGYRFNDDNRLDWAVSVCGRWRAAREDAAWEVETMTQEGYSVHVYRLASLDPIDVLLESVSVQRVKAIDGVEVNLNG